MSVLAYNSGLPSAADLTGTLDPIAAILKASYAQIGFGDPDETTTAARKALDARNSIFGIANISMQEFAGPFVDDLAANFRCSQLFGPRLRSLFNRIDQHIYSNIPAGMSFAETTGRRYLDLHVSRLNANDPSTPATPGVAPTLAATTGGAMPTVAVGNAPRVKYCYVSTAGRWIESQPSPASGQTALAGKNNAYTVASLTNPVPAGVGFYSIYRQLYNNAGSGDPYYWDQDVTVVPGAAPPTVTLKQADFKLRQDFTPPSWLSCMLLMEEAFMIAYGLASQAQGATQFGLETLTASMMLAALNVALNPANAFMGLNPVSTGEFGRAAATAYTEGAIQTANDATQNLQGAGGSVGKVQLRTLTTMDVNASVTNITYHYYNAANPTTLQTTGNAAGPYVLNLATGSIIDTGADIPSDRLVRRVTGMTITGPTSGTLVAESVSPRVI